MLATRLVASRNERTHKRARNERDRVNSPR
jgi:hypothetical protein